MCEPHAHPLRVVNMDTCNQKQKGFTLIEAMVTMLIVSVGLLAMASLLITAIRVNHNSEVRMEAATTAQSIMSHLVTQVTANAYKKIDPSATEAEAKATAEAAATTDAQNLLASKYKADRIGGFNPVVVLSGPSAVNQFTNIEAILEWSDHRGDTRSVSIRSGGFTR